ncbi:MAG TPA: mycofactocin biosynthesis glycosyltransferase MftF [Actinomycetaceae bacterium]|nr:mycofactocin biosynthesis glycosyltransferase MftF [Actinomycetaceae bacterium]
MSASHLPPDWPIALDQSVRLWLGGRYASGGAPWAVMELGAAASGLARRLEAVGAGGLVPDAAEATAADEFVHRGMAHPVPQPAAAGAGLADVTVIVPCHGEAAPLARCLAALRGPDVVVVDDGSPDPQEIARIAADHGARLVRHDANLGPGAARNTGLAHTATTYVAFVDADCVVTPGWIEALLPHLADPRVAAVGPRIRPVPARRPTAVAHHDAVRSALDMGPVPRIVRYGSPLGFLPTAALLVRRSALPVGGFAPDLRVGEDVDLLWRIIAAGWHVRYEPRVIVGHEVRADFGAWARRRFAYGTSAGPLDRRHPGRPAPAELSGWNLMALACWAAGRPRLAAAVFATSLGLLAREFRATRRPGWLGAYAGLKGLASDAAMAGAGLRREWWPVGWAAVAFARRCRLARALAVCALAPAAWEVLRSSAPHGRLRYAGLRIVEEVAYGSGALVSAAVSRRWRAVLPRLRPWGLRLQARRKRPAPSPPTT